MGETKIIRMLVQSCGCLGYCDHPWTPVTKEAETGKDVSQSSLLPAPEEREHPNRMVGG